MNCYQVTSQGQAGQSQTIFPFTPNKMPLPSEFPGAGGKGSRWTPPALENSEGLRLKDKKPIGTDKWFFHYTGRAASLPILPPARAASLSILPPACPGLSAGKGPDDTYLQCNCLELTLICLSAPSPEAVSAGSQRDPECRRTPGH